MIVEIINSERITLHDVIAACENDEKLKILNKIRKKYSKQDVQNICKQIVNLLPSVETDAIYKLLNIAAAASADDVRYLLKLPNNIEPTTILKLL